MKKAMSIRCDRCGKDYAVTAEYITEYEGQETVCECGAAILIQAQPVPVPLCGWESDGLVVAERGKKLPRLCPKCGVPLKSQMQQIVLEWSPGGDGGVKSIAADGLRGNLARVDVVGIVKNATAAAEIVARLSAIPIAVA